MNDEVNRGSLAGPTEAIVVAGLTAAALALRLFDLGHESIWYDEAFSLRVCDSGAWALIAGKSVDPGNPAGYFVLLALWRQVFGSSIEAARAMSALFGALAVPAAWRFARVLDLSPPTRLTAALLTAFSPPLVYLGREARCFALFGLVATMLATATHRCVVADRRRDWIAFAVLGALAVHLHYYAFFVLTALGLRIVGSSFGGGSPIHANWRRLSRLAAAALTIALAFAPYLKIFLWQLSLGSSRSGETWLQQLALMPLFSIAGRTLVWKEQGVGMVATANLACASILLGQAPALVRNARRLATPLAASVGTTAAAVAVSLLISPMIHTHYLSCMLPAAYVLMAFALTFNFGAANRRQRILIGCTAALMLASLFGVFSRPHKTDWRGVANFVEEHGAGRPVYFYEDIGADPYRYYRPGDDCRLISIPPGADAEAWEKTGWLDRMRADDRGFILVYYATNARSRLELEGVLKTLRQRWKVNRRVFGPIGPIEVLDVRVADANRRVEHADNGFNDAERWDTRRGPSKLRFPDASGPG